MEGPEFYNNLDMSEAFAWSLLQEGASNRQSPLHTLTVATLDFDGLPDARVMILRDANPTTRSLRFHTDARSPKAQAVGTELPTTVLAYHPTAKVQLRLRGAAQIKTIGPEVDAAWHAATLLSKRCYLGPAGPGDLAPEPSSGLPVHLEGRVPSPQEADAGRQNFALLLVTVTELDWLYLAHFGHRRAVFTYRHHQRSGEWRIP